MRKTLKATVTVDNRRITLEGPEDFVRAEVRRFITPDGDGDKDTSTSKSDRIAFTERDLIAQKRPKNQTDTVAVLGFCLARTASESSPRPILRELTSAQVSARRR